MVRSRPRRGRRRVVEVGERDPFERGFHDAFENPDHILVFVGHQRKGIAGALGATGATDAVDVGVGGVGHVVVDDVRDTVNVETARGDVGGDHDGEVPGLETVQGLLALSLRAIAVQARDAEPGMGDLARHLVGAMFGAREDQHRIGIDHAQYLDEQSRL